MMVTKKAIIKDGWVVCNKCGHKLGRVVGKTTPTGLEIKCSSCKELNLITRGKEKVPHYKIKHCIHCKEYKESTGTCIAILKQKGLKSRSSCKPVSCSKCASFIPKEGFEEYYKENE